MWWCLKRIKIFSANELSEIGDVETEVNSFLRAQKCCSCFIEASVSKLESDICIVVMVVYDDGKGQ